MPSIRSNSTVLPTGKTKGILTVLQYAYGEADVQPSLLLAYFSTPPHKCQGVFSQKQQHKLYFSDLPGISYASSG